LAQYHEDDVSMEDSLDDCAEAYATKESGSFGLSPATTAPPSDDDLAERNRQAHESYHPKLFIVGEKVMHKPNLDTLYYKHAASHSTMSQTRSSIQIAFNSSKYFETI
jgi:hypothetical protein